MEQQFGYLNDPELLAQAYELWPELLEPFRVFGSQGERPPQIMLFDLVRRVNGGKDYRIYAQECGDCTGHGNKHALQCSQALPILNGERLLFTEIHPSYHYGVSRVQIGQQWNFGDGSVGAWVAKALNTFGTIPLEGDGVPAYSGSISRAWGRKPGVPSELLTQGKKHLVGKAAKVATLEQADEALFNGYGLAVCSNRGFEMKARSDGFHYPSGRWDHCLACVGMDAGGGGIPRHYIIQNSWADTHGRLKDLRNPSLDIPPGCLRIHEDVFAGMLAQDDSFALSAFDGFPAKPLPPELFEPW